MGLFARKKRDSMEASAQVVVLCAFRDLTNREPLKNFDAEHAYAYVWKAPSPPAVGTWALVDGYEGPSTVVVGRVGLNEYVREHGVASLGSITRLVPDAQMRAAAASLGNEDQAIAAWLDHCAVVAGLDVQPGAGRIPQGFDEPKLPEQNATPESADANGGVWWRAYKKAEETGRSVEAARFKEVAQAWYRQRDQAAKAAQVRGIETVVAAGGLDRAIRAVVAGQDLGDRPGEFLGQPMWDWLRYAEEVAKKSTSVGADALELVYALIEVAERESKLSGREPAPRYTERAAILHRKRKEYAAEVAVIERWEAACPPEKRGPGALQAKLAARLVKARQLAETQSAGGPK